MHDMPGRSRKPLEVFGNIDVDGGVLELDAAHAIACTRKDLSGSFVALQVREVDEIASGKQHRRARCAGERAGGNRVGRFRPGRFQPLQVAACNEGLICQQKQYRVCSIQDGPDAASDRRAHARPVRRIVDEESLERPTGGDNGAPLVTGDQQALRSADALRKPHRVRHQRRIPIRRQLFR